LLAPHMATQLNGYRPEEYVRAGHAAAPADDPLAGMLAADTAMLLPDDFLVKVDRASMANGLEVRPPLLDPELLELAARHTSNWKVRNGETKWILKAAYRRQLPTCAVDRPKHGFEIPVDAWLRGPLRGSFEAAVLGPRAAVGDLVNQTAARKLFQRHLAGV